jgi:hypothetical protein
MGQTHPVDIEVQFAEHPVLAAAFVLCCLLSGACIFAFVMQWNSGEILIRNTERFMRERERFGSVVAALRWYFVGDWISAAEIWKETRGIRFVLLIGLAMGGLAAAIYYFTFA